MKITHLLISQLVFSESLKKKNMRKLNNWRTKEEVGELRKYRQKMNIIGNSCS